jgi:hypothetical protein
MSTRLGLALSSIAVGSLLTLAAAPALASAMTAAPGLAYNVLPANNTWGTPCSIDWATPTALTNGACLFTLSLQHDDPTISTSDVQSWWGMANPGSPAYYDGIVAGSHFTQVTTVADIAEGDLLAVKYRTSATSAYIGYLMLVEIAPALITGSTTRSIVGIIDSTQTPHGDTDTRWQADAGLIHDKGVGSGDIYIDADAVTGAITGHSWSAGSGSYYSQATRSMVVGRFVR